VGTPGTIPGSAAATAGATNLIYLGAGVKLTNAAVPVDGRIAILNPEMHAYLVSSQMTLFNPSSVLSEGYKSGLFARNALGISEWYMDQNVATHTVGTNATSTPLVNNVVVPASGATTIASNAWPNPSSLKKGDVVQFTGCYAVNPLNYASTGQLMDFVVTADVATTDATQTIPLSPAIVFGNQNAVCTNHPANNAPIKVFGSVTYSEWSGKISPQGLVYHPDAFALVMADLELPGGIWVSERISNKAMGISIRFLKDYNVMSDQSPARVDILYGWKAVRPEMACRVSA
jgi:hypothetical protein